MEISHPALEVRQRLKQFRSHGAGVKSSLRYRMHFAPVACGNSETAGIPGTACLAWVASLSSQLRLRCATVKKHPAGVTIGVTYPSDTFGHEDENPGKLLKKIHFAPIAQLDRATDF